MIYSRIIRAMVGHGFISLLKPNVTSLGYALFLAINATGTWGGVFPFLSMEFQTRDIVLGFFMAQSLTLTIICFLTTWLAYSHPAVLKRAIVPQAVATYFIGWVFLIVAMYAPEYAYAASIIAGIFLGLGSGLLLLLWQRVFAGSDPAKGTRDLIVGTAWSSVIYFLLYAIPRAITAYLIPAVFLPLSVLALVLATRTIQPDQPMFEDIPNEHPLVYKTAAKDYWQAVLCVSALALCAGVMRALAIDEVSIGSLVNILSMFAGLAAALVLLFIWKKRDLTVNIVSSYHMIFPLIITGLLFLPFLGMIYERWFASVMYAVYKIALLLMMLHAAQAARDRGMSPIFIYSLFSGIVYLFHNGGFIAGNFAEIVQVMNVSSLAAVAIFAIWVLSVMHFLGFGGWRRKPDLTMSSANIIELVNVETPEPVQSLDIAETDIFEEAAVSKAPTSAGEFTQKNENTSLGNDGFIIHDMLSKRVAAVKNNYHLSAREAEIVELIARGYTVARISTELVVSENTIRTHTKRIYTKLDIHKKAELLEILDNVKASEVKRGQ